MSGEASQPARGARRHIVERPRLKRLLDQTEADVILLVGPAGYGKTTLAQQWLADRSHGWFRATSSSTDVAALALGLAAAAESVLPEVRDRVVEKLKRFAEPGSNAESIADVLIEELRAWPAEAWLAIDDYHLAGSPSSDVLLERLRLRSGVKLLITSRERPSWASARSLLYGETYEVGQARLAMTEEEAIQVLGEHSDAAAGGLLSLADGWPAVIGLAAAAGTPIPATGPLPETLYRYFAEEVFQRAAPKYRTLLTACAVMPSITKALISSIESGDLARAVVEEGNRLGFFVSGPGSVFEMNPLLRSFLEMKFDKLPVGIQDSIIGSAIHFYLDGEEWDNAYSLIEGTRRFELVPRLIEASIDDVLADGRLASLAQWSTSAKEKNIRDPLLDLTDAEIAFRRGLHGKAQALALEAARRLGRDEPFRARAHLRAGQAAYFNDRSREAIACFEEARTETKDLAITREAIWGSFVSAIDLEQTNVDRLLRAYEDLPNQRVDDVLRLTTGRLSQGHRQGGLRDALMRARATAHLAGQVEDPMIRTAFWNGYAWSLALAAKYETAVAAASRALTDARDNGLEFVVPQARLVTAQACAGMGQNLKAGRLLDEIEADARLRDDDFLVVNARTLRSRLLIAEARPRDAISMTERISDLSEGPATRGERLAVRSLAFAVIGEAEAGIESLALARSATKVPATRMLTRIVAALLAGDGNDDHAISAAIREIAEEGVYDVLVLAYRGRRDLLEHMRATHEASEITALLERAHDEPLGQELGLLSRPSQRQIEATLSPREREVSALLAQGRTNAEIANALFISEVTVKVHVRHILAKMGVRNRSEAAVLIASQSD